MLLSAVHHFACACIFINCFVGYDTKQSLRHVLVLVLRIQWKKITETETETKTLSPYITHTHSLTHAVYVMYIDHSLLILFSRLFPILNIRWFIASTMKHVVLLFLVVFFCCRCCGCCCSPIFHTVLGYVHMCKCEWAMSTVISNVFVVHWLLLLLWAVFLFAALLSVCLCHLLCSFCAMCLYCEQHRAVSVALPAVYV